MQDKLSTYHAKRNFRVTPEPEGEVAAAGEQLRFVVQKHHARRLHYDFRLEFDGTLKSWAVPKGPSLDPREKRLAVHVEDHPLDYIHFEGDIPEKQYGAGHVDVWDTGTWEIDGDPAAAYQAGRMKFRLHGEKLHGGWTLVRTKLRGNSDKEQWLLIKENDEEARPASEYDITEDLPDSVLSKPRVKSRKSAKATQEEKASAPVRRKPSVQAKASPATDVGPSLHGAVKAKLPASLQPQLATLVDAFPQQGEWMYEIKFDGYRMLARVDGGEVKLFSRDGKDWTAKLRKQAEAVAELGLESAWLDGEVVVLDAQGVPSFQLLQNAFDEKSTAQIVYFLFDLPYLNGVDLRRCPLRERRALLEQVLAKVKPGTLHTLRYSAPIVQPPQRLLESACAMSMEGIIGKLADSVYTGRRSADWIKLKCRRRQEFVIGGYTEPQGTRKFFGALLLGVYDDKGRFVFAGRVGTGFGRAVLHSTYERLQALEQDKKPFDTLPAGIANAHTHWVKPQLVAEVSFAEWTHDDQLRQAVFHGLREDKKAKDIRREHAMHAPQLAPATAGDVVEGVKVTHADRVIDPASGATKLDLVRYYAEVAPHLLPWLARRPVYLLRCPEGVEGEHFFQKHSGKLEIPGITLLDRALDPGHEPLMTIDSLHALAGAAQMGAIELHTPNATADRFDRPDCMVFDLDPDPGLPWKRVVEAARLTRVVLDELGLKSFLKTSGGKGLHLVVPLARRHSWEDVTALSQAVAQHMARTLPKHFSAKMGAKNRVGKVFVDYLRNQKKASTIAPFSVRARPGLPVSVPIAWEELDDIRSAAEWTIANLPQRLAELKEDPWAGFGELRQTLNAQMKKKLAE